MRKTLKRIHINPKNVSYYISLLVLVSAYLGTPLVSAADFDETFYSSNDILFYDPRGGSCSVGGGKLDGNAPKELKGESNAEKVWNYLVERGLTPVAAAGAMGNLEQESSGFNPWAGESGNTTLNKSAMGVGFGIIQWTNTDGNAQGRRYKVMKYLEDNGIRLDATDASQMDKALLYQLNWLWDGEYSKLTWQEGVNAETTVEGNTLKKPTSIEDNTGNGSTLYFHASVERSADSPSGLQERIDSAKNFLDKFGNGTTGCSISEGGLTLSQAEKLMKYYADVDPESQNIVSPFVAQCSGSTTREQWLSNCVSFSTYFVVKFTSYKGASGHGKEKVGKLKSANADSQTGTKPQPFSVFSKDNGGCLGSECFGHTGVILGIHGETAVIGEASCGDGRKGTRAYEVPMSQLDSHYSYFYTDSSLKQDVLSGVVNE